MYHNEIGDEGAKALAEALGRNKTLTSIDLWGNKSVMKELKPWLKL